MWVWGFWVSLWVRAVRLIRPEPHNASYSLQEASPKLQTLYSQSTPSFGPESALRLRCLKGPTPVEGTAEVSHRCEFGKGGCAAANRSSARGHHNGSALTGQQTRSTLVRPVEEDSTTTKGSSVRGHWDVHLSLGLLRFAGICQDR